MNEKNLFEAALLARECRALHYKLRDVLEIAFFSNTRCSLSRRLEARLLVERLTNSTEALAEALQLPPYTESANDMHPLLRRRKRTPRSNQVKLQVQDARSE